MPFAKQLITGEDVRDGTLEVGDFESLSVTLSDIDTSTLVENQPLEAAGVVEVRRILKR